MPTLLIFDGLVYEVVGWRQVHAGDTYLMFITPTISAVATIPEEPSEVIFSVILRPTAAQRRENR